MTAVQQPYLQTLEGNIDDETVSAERHLEMKKNQLLKLSLSAAGQGLPSSQSSEYQSKLGMTVTTSLLQLLALAAVMLFFSFLPANTQEAAGAESDEIVLMGYANEPWIGDLDGILERGFLRVATKNSPLYFVRDGVHEGGFAVEVAHELETFLDKTYPKKGRRMNVVLMPLATDEILPAILEGRADVAMANLTITAQRSESVAFTVAIWKDINELVVTGPAAPPTDSLDDLAAVGLHLRKSSSYYEHVGALNEARETAGKAVIPVQFMDEYLNDHDILEMVNAGILPATIVDSHKATIWAQVFEDITLHENIVLNEGGVVAWALRRDSPSLMTALNDFAIKVRKGSLLGNVLIKRYLGGQRFIENVKSKQALSRYEATLGLIKKYANQYEFDWLMIVAQGFQESQLDQKKRSKAGAIGIMQVMPATAKDPVVGIPDVSYAENNIHAGVKYLRHLRVRFDADPEIAPLDRTLFAFAAYNAGPGNIRKARKRAEKMGLDHNRWFDNVEIAAGKAISREPVIYVRNIYKYYVAYKHLQKLDERRSKKSAVD